MKDYKRETVVRSRNIFRMSGESTFVDVQKMLQHAINLHADLAGQGAYDDSIKFVPDGDDIVIYFDIIEPE